MADLSEYIASLHEPAWSVVDGLRRLPYRLTVVPALAAAVALAGCTSQPVIDVELLPVGSTLTDLQVKELRKNTQGELRAYETAAGELLLVDRTKALPDAVRDDALAELEAASATGDPQALYDMVHTLSYQTGRKIIAVTTAVVEGEELWMTLYGYQDAWMFETKDEAIAKAELIRITAANPDAWEILDTPDPAQET